MSMLVALLLMLPSAHAGELTTHNTLAWSLDNTTWCFEDKEGPWDHGRIHFDTKYLLGNPAFYDVTDAPGGGGIDMKWSTYWTFSGWTISLSWPQGGRTKHVRAYVESHDDYMIWTFKDDGRVSRLNLCAKP